MKTIKKAEILINKEKDKLIAKAKNKGINENFGEKEIAKIDKALGYPNFYNSAERELANLVMNFSNWCMNFNN